ncbi:zinc finger protein OZF-like [Ptychodera flava]|uniref:zinc finger protein OZF-like n=1 Tax=Ptychodera flava TaxID=63121 RepID=UPI00396A590F
MNRGIQYNPQEYFTKLWKALTLVRNKKVRLEETLWKVRARYIAKYRTKKPKLKVSDLLKMAKTLKREKLAIKVEDEDSFSSGKSKVFTCVTCKGTFMTKTKLLNHEKVHRAQKTQVGKNRKSLQSDNGRVETQQNVNNGKGKVCEEEVRKKLDHDTCHSGFDPASKPARHVKQRAKKLHCDQCDKTFDAKHRLRDHQRTHTGERPYCCDKCGKAFHSKASLREHGPTHSDKIFPCEICGRKFNRKASVRLHMRRHTGGNIDKRKKPFCCKQCGKSFHRNRLLTWHMNTHTGDKPYQCDICRRCFHYETSLKFHIQRHSQGKAFKCSVCSKSFFARSDLVCHVRMHTGEKPFQCEHCGKCFSRSYGLYSHMRRHKNTLPAAVH